jgi:hypothetical protein
MKYYTEEDTKEIRLVLEQEVLGWYQVDFKKMFGCPCYTANCKLFIFLVTKGLVITRLNETDRVKLSVEYGSKPFRAGTKDMANWCQIPIDTPDVLAKVMPFIRRSYEEALKQP